MNWKLFDSRSGAVFADVDVNIEDPAKPGPPDQWLLPKEATLPDGGKVQLDADFSFTEESLRANQTVWEHTFGRPLENCGGSIAKENLANFQIEYAKIRDQNPGMTEQEIGDRAIRNVSFGKARIRIGFGDLSVNMSDFGNFTIAEGHYKGQSVTNVPREVTVSARRVVGSGNAP